MHIVYTPNSNLKVYSDIPSYLCFILNEFPHIAGFVLGGTFAKGNYTNGEDIDLDIIFYNKVSPYNKQYIRDLIQYHVQDYVIDIRHFLSQEETYPSIAKNFLQKDTPFVVRDNFVKEFWGLQELQ